MMWDWQTITALFLVASAGLFVMRRVRNLFAGGSAGCGNGTGACGNCPSSQPQTAVDQKTLVQLEVMDRES